MGNLKLIDDQIVLEQLAVGLTELHRRTSSGKSDVLPYPANLQAAYDQLALRSVIRQSAAPSSVVELLEWAEMPLEAWPTPLISDESEAAGETLLSFGQLTATCDEYGVMNEGDVVAEARESATIAAVRDRAKQRKKPQSYVAYRGFLIRNPVVEQLELAMVLTDPDLHVLADLVQDSYEDVRPEWITNGAVEVCGSCGNVLVIVPGERRRVCHSTLCHRQSAGGATYAPEAIKVLRRDLRRYVGGPGRSEVRLYERLSESGIDAELWPDYDAYDLRVFDALPWAVDVKAWVNPVRLAQHLNSRPPIRPNGADRMFIVIADELATDGYIGSVKAWRDSTWRDVEVVSESAFVTKALAASKGRA